MLAARGVVFGSLDICLRPFPSPPVSVLPSRLLFSLPLFNTHPYLILAFSRVGWAHILLHGAPVPPRLPLRASCFFFLFFLASVMHAMFSTCAQAMLFGLFTMCMVCDQWEVVSTNQTQIDRLKGETHSAPSLEIK